MVGSYDWNTGGIPGNEYPSKLYFYFGGDDFDNIPELTVDGTQYPYQTALGYHIVNLGDVNGDGYEDLGSRRAGEHSIIWNGRDSNGNRVSSGIYFYKLKAGDFQKVRKMILIK